MQRIRQRPSYANVMSTIAVFVALGGTSYAAITLPRNSVGSAQLKAGSVKRSDLGRGAVGSRALRAGAVAPSDLSARTKASLRGPQGPPGPAGPGVAAFRATIGPAGEQLAGNPNQSGRDLEKGAFIVGFGADLTGCTPTATLRDNVSGSLRAYLASINTVAVTRINTDGTINPSTGAFNLIVAC